MLVYIYIYIPYFQDLFSVRFGFCITKHGIYNVLLSQTIIKQDESKNWTQNWCIVSNLLNVEKSTITKSTYFDEQYVVKNINRTNMRRIYKTWNFYNFSTYNYIALLQNFLCEQ